MRRMPLLALLLLTGAMLPAAASAQDRCPDRASCRTVTVPLDRSGNVAGTIGLRVARLQARSATRTPVLALSGGPGQASRGSLLGFAEDLGSTVLRQRDLIAFDARGTGYSGALDCPEMQRTQVPRDTAAAEACAARLGEQRRFYTTIDQAEDIEEVRAALGAEKLVLYGISYGTKAALTYARLHPDRVEGLILDSVVSAEGASALSQEILGAMPRVLGASRLAQIGTLVDRVRTTPAVGVAIDRRGKRHRTTAYPAAIFDILLAGDFNPVIRKVLPSAIRAVEAGDPALLMRLVHNAQASEAQSTRRTVFSAGLYAATSCEEIAFPWAPDTPMQERLQRAREAAAQAPALAPFKAEDILTLDWIPLCLRWPLTPGPRPLPAATPDVPALLINGAEDLRTPLEEARQVKAQLPQARLLSVRGVGHSVVGSDPSRCARRALRAFLLAKTIPSRCPRATTFYDDNDIPVPPRSFATVRRRVGGSRVDATLASVGLTIADSLLALDLSPTGFAAGGLRRGTVRWVEDDARLSSYEYVPGVIVTTRGQRIIVSGSKAARGVLTFRGGRFRGRLGGRRIG